MNKKYFMLRLNPPRPTFAQDMTVEERKIMLEHVAYWKSLMKAGLAVVFGPVLDPKGVYGLGIVCADDEEQVAELVKNDPANGLNQYEYYPMMAVVKE
jgi:hypothetical protein